MEEHVDFGFGHGFAPVSKSLSKHKARIELRIFAKVAMGVFVLLFISVLPRAWSAHSLFFEWS